MAYYMQLVQFITDLTSFLKKSISSSLSFTSLNTIQKNESSIASKIMHITLHVYADIDTSET